MEEQWESVTTMNALSYPQMLLHSGCCLLTGNSVSQPYIPMVTGSLWADCQKQPGSDCPWLMLSWVPCLTPLGPQRSVSGHYVE